MFPYKFDFKMAPRDVTVTLFYSRITGAAWGLGLVLLVWWLVAATTRLLRWARVSFAAAW